MKNGKKFEELLMTRLDEIHADVKKINEDTIPAMKVEIASIKKQAGLVSTAITLVGGALAVALAWFKKN